MNQKKLTIFLVAVIIILTVALVYIMILQNGTGTPQIPQPQTSNNNIQNNQNQKPSLNETPEKSNLTRLVDLGIEVEFFDGYEISKSDGKTIILFGPLGKELSPIPTDEESHIYNLSATEKSMPEKVIAQINKDAGELITVKPELKMINDISVVEWAEGGYCENRMMEVIGPKKNYLLSSLGCHKDQEFDFDYFEKTVKTIKFLP